MRNRTNSDYAAFTTQESKSFADFTYGQVAEATRAVYRSALLKFHSHLMTREPTIPHDTLPKIAHRVTSTMLDDYLLHACAPTTCGQLVSAWRWFTAWYVQQHPSMPALAKPTARVFKQRQASIPHNLQASAPAIVEAMQQLNLSCRELANLRVNNMRPNMDTDVRRFEIATIYENRLYPWGSRGQQALMSVMRWCYPTKIHQRPFYSRHAPVVCHPPDSGQPVLPLTLYNVCKVYGYLPPADRSVREERFVPHERMAPDGERMGHGAKRREHFLVLTSQPQADDQPSKSEESTTANTSESPASAGPSVESSNSSTDERVAESLARADAKVSLSFDVESILAGD